jgi:hypothetical protein
MANEMLTFELDFHLEPGDSATDLERSAATVRDTISALPGVDDVDAQVADQVRMADPVTIGAVVLTVTAGIRGAADLTGALDELLNNVKELARDAGLPHLWIWLHRKKVKVENLTGDDLRELAAEADPSDA